MGRLLIGYTTFMLTLFALGAALAGLETTLFGFAVFYAVCTVIVITLLWWSRRQQPTAVSTSDLQKEYVFPLSASLVSSRSASQNPDELLTVLAASFKEGNVSLLESRVAAITDRVSTAYPLVARDDIHKIVWMALIEICHDQMQITDRTASETTRRFA